MASGIEVQDLSKNSFQDFGVFAGLEQPEGPKIGQAPIEFFRDQIQHPFSSTDIPSYSTCVVEPREFLIDTAEYHSYCREAILPMDGDVLIHVAEATPPSLGIPYDSFKVFYVPKGTMVVLHPGVWHHAPYTITDEKVHVLIVLPERAYANDCHCFPLEKEKRIPINFKNT